MQGNSQAGWQMDTTCPTVVNATSVNCSNKKIKNLTGIQYFDNMTTLNCSYDSLISLPPLHPPLTTLYCQYNQLTSLPALPAGLTSLYCEINQITSLPALPSSLTRLDCYYNSLIILPFVPWTITYIDCNHNNISSFVNMPNTVTTLRCHFNNLTALPLSPALTHLSCGNNPWGNFTSLPSSLTYLDCRNDQMTVLPVLPSSLRQFNCESNQLTSLPTLPLLSTLECNYNQLTSLPALPTYLTWLSCSYNQLGTLPTLPSSLKTLYCINNQLSTLPILPDTMTTCLVYNNPLNCLPELTRIGNLNFSSTNVTCLANYGSVVNSTPPLKFLPLCDPFNSNGCTAFWNIAGNVYYDANNNCVKNVTDTAQRNIKVELRSGGNLLQQVFTGGEGFYSFDVDSFATYNVSVDTTNIAFRVSCPANNLLLDTITTIDSLDYSKDFALKCKTGFDLTTWSVTGWRFRPANFTTVNIHAGDITNFYGVHCAAGVSGTVTTTITGAVTFISPAISALTPTVSGNVLTYTIADFGSVNFFSDFNIVLQTDTTAPIGSQICINVSVTPTVGDNNPANNTLTHCFTVVGSFDPNDKQVYPAGDIAPDQEWLIYTVRFQNTGTDTAYHVYITDTLDADLDVSSFQLLAYSHQPMVQLKENAVRFNFPNIMLVDSHANEPLSHGYVQYKIKLKDNLPIGTQINNTAFIYFDFNAPVVTNTTSNTIATITDLSSALSEGEGAMQIQVYPNPASDVVTIRASQKLAGAKGRITDIAGRTVLSFSFGEGARRADEVAVQLSTANFANGVYFVTIKTTQGRSLTRKLVKQ